MQNAVRSGMGLLGMHPSASLTHPLHQPGLTGQRMPGLLPLELRPNLLQPGGAARFPLLLQQGPPPQAAGLLDSPLQAQARVRAPFSQMDPFNRVPNLPSDSVSKPEEESSSGADEGKDQDYRFPPMEKQSTGLLRTPQPDHRELGGGGGGRPALLQTPGTQPPRTSLLGRLQALAGFTPDNRWTQARGDFDERDGMRGAPGAPKGFQEDRPTPGQSYPGRFDSRPGTAGGAPAPGNVGAGAGSQAWNRGGGATGAFDSELHQDLDDRRRSWDRQRDRDERDFDFRRDMNGTRHSRDRDRDRDHDRDRDRERGRDRPREHERDKDRDREHERGGWTPLLPLPTPLLPTPPLNPNLSLNQGKLLAPLKFNTPTPPRFQPPQTKPLLGPMQPLPQANAKTPPPSQSQAAEPEVQTPTPPETRQAQSPPRAQSPASYKADSPLAEAHPDTPPPTESPARPTAEPTPTPDTGAPGPASPLPDPSHQDSPLASPQAVSPPGESTPSLEEQGSPQEEETPCPPPHRVNGPETNSSTGVEPTPEASPEPPGDPSSSESDPEQREPREQQGGPEDIESDDSEPPEDAASQPVVDTVTDTEGT